MPELQSSYQCGVCYDWVSDARKLPICGHNLCLECVDEQTVRKKDVSGGRTQMRGISVLRYYGDWYNIDLELKDDGKRPDVGGTGEDSADGSDTRNDDLAGNISGCRMCQNRIFRVADPEKAKHVPILQGIRLLEDATKVKLCETEHHESVQAEANFYCFKCDKYICKDCKTRFHMIRTLEGEGDHCRVVGKPVLTGERPVGDNLYLRQLSQVSGCVHHNGSEQTHFCLQCKRLICVECLRDNHVTHDVESLRLAIGEVKEKTKSDLDRLSSLHRGLYERQRALSVGRADKLRQFEKMGEEVEKSAAEMCARITSVKQNLLRKIDDEKRTCLDQMQKYEDDLKNVDEKVKIFGEAVHMILNTDNKILRDAKLNQSVLVQRYLAQNRSEFDSLEIPLENIALKRLLTETVQFKQNTGFLERIFSAHLGKCVRLCQQTFPIRQFVNEKPELDGNPMRTSPARILCLENEGVIMTENAERVKVLRSNPEDCEYQVDLNLKLKKTVTGLADLGHGYVLVVRSNKMKVINIYELPEQKPLQPDSCGPGTKFEICSVANEGGTLYFACYDKLSNGRKGVIYCQDYQYDRTKPIKMAPFRFSLCEEYCRIHGDRPNCLAVRRHHGLLQMAIGHSPFLLTFVANEESISLKMSLGDNFRILDICFDNDGDVLVANGHSVLLYSIEGELKGVVIGPEHDIQRPIALAITRENDVIVGESNMSLKSFVFRKYDLTQLEFRCIV